MTELPGSADERPEALLRLRELRSRQAFLQSAKAWGPGYKIWIGDIVEFAQDSWGSGSLQLTRIAGLLRGSTDGELDYLTRLRGLDALLASFERDLTPN